MAGKVLTEEDFKGGTGNEPEETPTPTPTPEPKEEKVEPKEEPTPDVTEGGDESLPKPSDKTYKYANMEEFDKAYKEAERKMHGATSELADTKRKLAQYEKPPEAKIPTEDERIATLADEAMSAISALPLEYDFEGKPTAASISKRDRDSAIIWAKTQRKISRLEIEGASREAESQKSAVSRLYSHAKTEGINVEDEDEMAELAFQWDRASANQPTEDRVSQAVDSAKGRLTRLREGYVKKMEDAKNKDKKEKDDLKVLGRGSTRKDKTGGDDEKPMTMSQQLASLNESRRLKTEDLR